MMFFIFWWLSFTFDPHLINVIVTFDFRWLFRIDGILHCLQSSTIYHAKSACDQQPDFTWLSVSQVEVHTHLAGVMKTSRCHGTDMRGFHRGIDPR